MNKVNYSQLYQKLTKGLSQKTKDIFDRRFGVKTAKQETLESIGKSMGITRERVRQIEEAGFTFVKNQNIYSFWSTIQNPEIKVKEILANLIRDFKTQGSPLFKKDFSDSFAQKSKLSKEALLSYLQVSKKIQENGEGKIGLIEWPEIKPRGVRDRAFLVFKKHQKPLHFTKVAEMIDKFGYNLPNKKTYPQTVHNELIKDLRFVLVGRGTYALQEWGYSPGTIKDVIVKVLEKKNMALDKEEIVKEVLSQRLVAKNTVLMNLNNKEYFQKDEAGKYFLRKTQTA
ncbi:MAG: hypothetical protein HYS02_00140 [Candidatus Staskawiczbacteria bacterium]|nr:hypothetical protein [Candidatus Staskawiczbacteria bacterium]